MDGIQPTYALGNNDAFGGSGIWLFAILALMWGGNGFFGGRNNGSPATVEDLASQSNFTRLEAQGTAINQAIANGFTNISNGLCSTTYELKTAIDAVAKEMATCCCGLSKEILESRYLTSKEIDSVKELINQNKIEALQSKVNELQLHQALCGVVRYPVMATYQATNPFCPATTPTTAG
jgi:hypothetical protein